MLNVGDNAPEFVATDCRGKPVSISKFGSRPVVLFFFPKAFTVGCTIEIRAFRDNYEKIRQLGAELVGVSVDTVRVQCDFAQKEDIDFPLIGDESKKISEAYGVLWPVLNVDRRATFIIDEQGKVEHVVHHEVKVYRHLDDVLAYLEKRAARPAVT